MTPRTAGLLIALLAATTTYGPPWLDAIAVAIAGLVGYADGTTTATRGHR